MKCILAIDQSTSATKALLFGMDGAVIDSESLPHAQHYPRPGWVEHDCEEIWQNVLLVVRRLCDRDTEHLQGLQCVSITNQRETVVVFDRATGEPLTPAIVWQCRRSDAICQELRDAGHEASVQDRTGLKLDAYFSASKLAWLVRERPGIANKLRSREALVGTIDTYLIYRLTAGRIFATDHTNASRTLLFNIKTLAWDPELCGLFGVPPCALAGVRESCEHFGASDFAGALQSPAPICGVMGDSQASLFSQRCFSPGDAKATFGTGTSVLLNIGPEPRLPDNGAVAALAWVLDGKPTYAWEGLISNSAATLSWLKDQLGLIASAGESEQIASSVADCGGVYLVPAFAGLSAPYWRPDARGAIVGMTAYTNRAHVVRAALESIAYQVNDVLGMMQSSGVAPRSLNVDGGPTRNGLLMQMVADITRLEVHVSGTPQSSALGAAMAGMVGLGLSGADPAASLNALRSMPRPTRQFSPTRDAREVAELTEGWSRAVARVL
ncbi:Glycerol kinase [Pirellulimonas nuda]|uniref:ATP:glycerol 3-phosphotransferase n=1 Tax=Pirellulimonas nuda TaxID=2528009 RepID=A0A518DG69_9BACT|nr:glycerol kinase GlpK [Pirellulimonas nuda]QDU90422.1 Glycerol kinase [Pirellulimonas nuda]